MGKVLKVAKALLPDATVMTMEPGRTDMTTVTEDSWEPV
jgi:hypothetical protein